VGLLARRRLSDPATLHADPVCSASAAVENVGVSPAAERGDAQTTENEPSDSPRKRELLNAAYGYALTNGLADFALRPMAKAIGTSPRVLLFLFGSKDGLTRALLARARQDELAALATLRAGPTHVSLADTGREIWAWLVAPSHRALLSLWLEGYARSLLGESGPWERFAAETVDDWLALLATRQPAGRRGSEKGEADRTLLLAVLRGALLDVLATGDADRVTRAVERYLDNLPA
jgi:AcrR family transcriptional regulator